MLPAPALPGTTAKPPSRSAPVHGAAAAGAAVVAGAVVVTVTVRTVVAAARTGPGLGAPPPPRTPTGRQPRGLDGRDQRVQAQHCALALAHDLLVVRVAEHRDEDPLDAHGRLDHVRRVALAVLADELELGSGRTGVRGQVEVAAVCDAF